MKKIFSILFINLFIVNLTFANEQLLKELETSARQQDIKFVAFSTTEGEKLFRTERMHSKGEKISCMTCHTSDPKKSGMTRANKVIDPIAPVANSERFTDMTKVQKWFKRNCNDVLERECTIQEKGNFVKYMMSIK